MSHIRVLICRVDDPASEQMTELAAFDLPATDVSALQPETALDQLETTTQETGNAILRRTLQAQWDLIDAQLTEQHRQRFSRSAHPGRRPRARECRESLHPEGTRARAFPPDLLPSADADPRDARQHRLAPAQRHHHHPRPPSPGRVCCPRSCALPRLPVSSAGKRTTLLRSPIP
jgi:hypothetical protein